MGRAKDPTRLLSALIAAAAAGSCDSERRLTLQPPEEIAWVTVVGQDGAGTPLVSLQSGGPLYHDLPSGERLAPRTECAPPWSSELVRLTPR